MIRLVFGTGNRHVLNHPVLRVHHLQEAGDVGERHVRAEGLLRHVPVRLPRDDNPPFQYHQVPIAVQVLLRAVIRQIVRSPAVYRFRGRHPHTTLKFTLKQPCERKEVFPNRGFWRIALDKVVAVGLHDDRIVGRGPDRLETKLIGCLDCRNLPDAVLLLQEGQLPALVLDQPSSLSRLHNLLNIFHVLQFGRGCRLRVEDCDRPASSLVDDGTVAFHHSPAIFRREIWNEITVFRRRGTHIR